MFLVNIKTRGILLLRNILRIQQRKDLWYQFKNTFLLLNPVAKGNWVTSQYFPKMLKKFIIGTLISSLLRSYIIAVMCFKCLFFLNYSESISYATKTRPWLRIIWFRFSCNCIEIPWVKRLSLGKIKTDNVQ